mgnify:CR=1 FL=1
MSMYNYRGPKAIKSLPNSLMYRWNRKNIFHWGTFKSNLYLVLGVILVFITLNYLAIVFGRKDSTPITTDNDDIDFTDNDEIDVSSSDSTSAFTNISSNLGPAFYDAFIYTTFITLGHPTNISPVSTWAKVNTILHLLLLYIFMYILFNHLFIPFGMSASSRFLGIFSFILLPIAYIVGQILIKKNINEDASIIDIILSVFQTITGTAIGTDISDGNNHLPRLFGLGFRIIFLITLLFFANPVLNKLYEGVANTKTDAAMRVSHLAQAFAGSPSPVIQ